jgi:hypothetical protein
MVKIFFSYSHNDETLRDELEIHLSILKRQGVIETWHDRRIGAGQEVNHEISEHLETADIILLLVSPYFLDSDYCYDVEMKRAMERHENGQSRVIPVILHSCDWHGTPFGKLLATPTDGKPISKFPNQHDAFLEVTKAIREAAEQIRPILNTNHSKVIQGRSDQPLKAVTPDLRSSNLRITKKFTDRQRDRFLAEAFEYIASFFEGSLSELKRRNPEVDTEFRRVDANNFGATVYIRGTLANRCRIWLGGRGSYPGGIAYSIGDSLGSGGFNESLSVIDDGYTLFLKPLGLSLHVRDREEKMTFEGGGEYLWGIFVEVLQH